MMRHKRYLVLAVIFALLMLYIGGPKPPTPQYQTTLPEMPVEPHLLDSIVARMESRHTLKPGNQAHIVWHNDTLPEKTPYALVYLHGFSASHHEGYPLHRNLAERYGFNLFLSRLHDHGIDTTEALLKFSAEKFYDSARFALAIGTQIGEKVILLSTSTGGTAALKLAAEFPQVHAIINLSPNVRINDPFAFLLNNPWGLQIANIVLGDEYRYVDGGDEYAKYWNTKYRNEALIELQELIETTMIPETFERVSQPVFNGFYFANDTAQDKVVKVEAIRWMHDLLATPEELKVIHAFDTPGDHVLASPIKSKDVESVEREVSLFIEEILQIKPL